jgi:pyroglutamyl-peptidase
MVILLTGFEPNDSGVNASQILVESLAERPPPELERFGDVRCEIMPGDTRRLEESLRCVLDRHRPRICIFTGQAPNRSSITFERIATNLRDFSSPDRAGNLIQAEAVVPGGPVAYWSTLPDLPALVAALHHQDIPAAPSNHAGNHLCNQLLYLGLHLAPLRDPVPAVGFVHVPLVPRQAIHQRPGSPSMHLDVTRRAVVLILATLCAASRRK